MPQMSPAFLRALPWLHPRRCCFRIDRTEAPPRRVGPVEVVLSRGLCRFSRFDLSRVPEGKRDPALQLLLTAWAPFEQLDCAWTWDSEGWATVWCWDTERLAAQLASEGLQSGRVKIIPESVLHPVREDGFRCVAALDGFEAQYWVSGALRVSRWWPVVPDASDWAMFVKDVGGEAASTGSQGLPAVEQVALQEIPWAKLRGSLDAGGLLAVRESLAYGLLALLIGIPASWMAVDQWQLSQARGRVAADIGRLSEGSRAVLEARDRATAAAESLQALNDLQRFPVPLVHMVALARALPDDGSLFVKEWETADGKLRVLVRSRADPPAGADLVRSLELTGLFSDVKIITQAEPRELGFLMSLKTQAQLAVNASPGATDSEPHPRGQDPQ